MSWLDLWRASRNPPAPPAPAAAPRAEPVEEPEDLSRCPKRWMGKRCVLGVGHVGICKWQ